MKKSILMIAAAAMFAFGMTSCTDEPIIINSEDTEITNGPLVKTTSDLNNTHWTCSVSLADLLVGLTGFDMGCMDSIDATAFESYLKFDGTYAHFTFSDNVEMWGMGADDMMQQITGMDFAYIYDGATHTGMLNGEDEEGNDTGLTFTYDDATDDITFMIPMSFDGDTVGFNVEMVFHRAI